ncbi:MAG: hypothetical protein KF773_24745 [Deltaproteobacteria bacterium]|nr:hypothetical protein [Deltaproteobacteria bacterium]
MFGIEHADNEGCSDAPPFCFAGDAGKRKNAASELVLDRHVMESDGHSDPVVLDREPQLRTALVHEDFEPLDGLLVAELLVVKQLRARLRRRAVTDRDAALFAMPKSLVATLKQFEPLTSGDGCGSAGFASAG